MMVPRWRFFASCILREPCAAHFRPAFLFRTKATSSLQRLRLGEEKRKKKPQDENIMSVSATQGGHNKNVFKTATKRAV